MPALTATEYFTLAGLPVESDPALVNEMITLADEDYLEIRGKPLETDELGAPVYPRNARRSQFEMVQFLLSGQVSEDGEFGYPSSIIKTIPRFVGVK